MRGSPLGDFVRARRLLDADDAASAALARMLGACEREQVARTAPASSPAATASDEARRLAPLRPAADDPRLGLTATQPMEASPARRTEVRVEREASLSPTAPSWAANVMAMPTSVQGLRGVPLSSLLDPRLEHAILATALATLADDGDLDMERIVAAAARRSPLRRLPRRRRLTLRRGAVVLRDGSESMTPFRGDGRALVERLRRIVGMDRVATTSFAGPPKRRADRSMAWSPPAAGIPVMVVSDFGIGGGWDDTEDPKAWLDVFAAARRAGCRVVALVPRRRESLPDWLEAAAVTLEWDRRTTVSEARRAVRCAWTRGG